MWITKLQLSNIKSYGPDSPPITFQPGVNLIQGSNGAGKSTILEAIGLALFDSKPYNLGQFVREGERTGKIAVGFMSVLDEREYEVVRQVGGGSQSYVYDPEVGRKLCEGREDTQAFIRQHLNLDAETDLTTLFEDAIGVPQGTMTAAFRERPSDRKQKFNRLLQIEVYERTWNELLKTGNHIRDLIAQNASQQSELRGMLRDRPTLEAEIAEQAVAIAAAEEDLARVEADLAGVAAAVDAADACKRQLDDLAGRITVMRGELGQAELRLEQARTAHAEAVEAAVVVEQTRVAHAAYDQARQSLDAAEEERRERDRLQAALHALDTRAQVVAQSLERLQQELDAVAAAEAELARLESQVARQAELERTLVEAQEAGQEQERLTGQLARQRERLEQQRQRLGALLAEAGIADDAPVAVTEPDVALSLDALIDGSAEALAVLQRVADQWKAAETTLEAARQTLEEVQDGTARRTVLERDLAAAQEARRDLETQAGTQRQGLSQARHELEVLTAHEALLSTTGATCPVCRQPVDAHAQADAQAHYAAERDRLNALQGMHEAQLVALEARLQAAEAERDSLEDALYRLPLAAAFEDAQRRAAEADTARDESVTRLQTAAQRSRAAHAAGMAQLQRENGRLAVLAEQAADVRRLEAELAALGDPRTARTRARLTADRRAEWQAELETARAAAEEVAGEQRDLEGEAAQYAGLDDRLDALRQEMAGNEADHTRYLGHVALAGQVDARLLEVRRCEAGVADRAEALDALERERETLAEDYDATQHETDRATRRQLEDEQLRLDTSLGALRNALAGLRARLAQMDAHARTLDSAEAAARRLEQRQAVYEFVRQTVREAGPRITRQLVRVISEQANRIFGDLLGDHSYILSWSEDYGITVNSRGEAREFELLSGGEQMVAAMAVRLALLTQLANVRFAFFDEPTTNLDETRRNQLAASLAEIQSLHQLFVISHDDTFEQESYHVIQVYKEQDLSQVEIL